MSKKIRNFLIFAFIILVIIFYCMCTNAFYMQNTDWLQALVGWISASSAIFIGLVAFDQNEKFDEANKEAQQNAETKAEEYQNKLMDINNRLIHLENNKQYSFVTFISGVCNIRNSGENSTKLKDVSPYLLTIDFGLPLTEDGRPNITDIDLEIANMSDVAVQSICINTAKIKQSHYNSKVNFKELFFEDFISMPCPLMLKGEQNKIHFVLSGIRDFTKYLKNRNDLSLLLDIYVTSVFGKVTNQVIELQFMEFKQKRKKEYYCSCFQNDIKFLSEEEIDV